VILNLYGNLDGLSKGIEILKSTLNYEVADNGIPIKVVNEPGNIHVELAKGQGLIKYDKKVHFFRALGLFMEDAAQKNEFKIIEEPQFEMNGPMVDVSRNAVLSIKSAEKLIELLAVMGLNMLMLYTEDIYTVQNYPYFGYMRGRYTYDEMKELDDYADCFGIEIIPCIQTLAHLEQFLKWRESEPLKDTSSVLLVGEEKVYTFIEEIIKASVSPLRTKRIHLGMDEAWDLGLGNYLLKNGYTRRHDIMNLHAAKVIDITRKLGLKPMIWSDMYFRLGSKTNDYYDENAYLPDDVIKQVPKELQLVYWDYYHDDIDSYKKFISLHKRFNNDIIFAGGLWTWNGLVVNYRKAFNVTNSALEACKAEGIKEVIATMWGDNGAETNIFSALAGLQLFAEHGYSRILNQDKLKRRFEFCTGGNFDSFFNISLIDQIPGTEEEHQHAPSNPSKPLLYQDILLGLFDKHIEGMNLNEYYSNLEKKLSEDQKNNPSWDFVFDVPGKLCSVLSIKAELGINIKKMYDSGDKEGLKKIIENDLPKLYEKVDTLRKAHRKQWLATYKPFGWEVLDIRYGGVLARIDSTIERLTLYLEGKIDKIEELEQERLYFDGMERPTGVKVGHINRYNRIVSACPI